MTDLTAIREGLAANMHALLGSGHVKQVSPWRLDNPTGASLQVAGIRSVVWSDFGGGAEIRFIVQALIPRGSDTGAQKILDKLLFNGSDTSLTEALEADGQLTSRYTAAGGLQTSQGAAASAVGVEQFEGDSIFKPLGVDTEYLVGTWIVLVVT